MNESEVTVCVTSDRTRHMWPLMGHSTEVIAHRSQYTRHLRSHNTHDLTIAASNTVASRQVTPPAPGKRWPGT